MTDRELLDALNVIARKAGLLPDGVRFTYEPVPEAPRDDALCLAFGKYREVRLCCTYVKGHVTGDILNAPSAHSWERSMVGKSACVAVAGQLSFGADVVTCELPTHHAGAHAATGADGVLWSWSGAPKPCGDIAPDGSAVCIRDAGHELPHQSEVRNMSYDMWPVDAYGRVETGELGTVCTAWEYGTNGHKAGCMLSAGHGGPHKGLDADGKSVFTWPCPCYPDCGGHTVGELCGAKNAAVNPVMAGQVCALLRGHEGSHEATVNGQRWLFGRTDPTEPRAS